MYLQPSARASHPTKCRNKPNVITLCHLGQLNDKIVHVLLATCTSYVELNMFFFLLLSKHQTSFQAFCGYVHWKCARPPYLHGVGGETAHVLIVVRVQGAARIWGHLLGHVEHLQHKQCVFDWLLVCFSFNKVFHY